MLFIYVTCKYLKYKNYTEIKSAYIFKYISILYFKKY